MHGRASRLAAAGLTVSPPDLHVGSPRPLDDGGCGVAAAAALSKLLGPIFSRVTASDCGANASGSSGEKNPSEVAERAGTIPWDVFASLQARLPRLYHRGGAVELVV